ncbi:long-chain-fatty-acid--CoA ligase [Hoeflea sp. CAU 1731]
MIEVDALTTLSALARANAKRAPDQLANRFEGRDTTFAEFDANVSAVAGALEYSGAVRIAYLGKNSDWAFELYIGAGRAGGVFAPINWRLAPREVAQIIETFEPDLLFVGPEFHDVVREISGQLPDSLGFVAMEGGHEAWPSYEEWREAGRAAHCIDCAEPDKPTLVLFTSGTTGLPKGVTLTHFNLLSQRVAAAAANFSYDNWQDDDVNLVAMPVAHIGGVGSWNLGFANACAAVITREFSAESAIDAIEEDRASRMFLVPAAVQLVVRHPRAKTADFSAVRSIFYGAAPMPLELLREAMALIGCEFAQVYGMTETTGTVSILMPEDHDPAGSPRMLSAGKAMPGAEICIMDPEGNKLPPGAIGEVAIRGATVMPGYWNNDDATRAVKSGDGWLRSGDAGYIDEDGYVFIHDRIKDMIVSGAENVYPAEVENAIFGHPDVGEVAVIGIPDDDWGEAVKAIVTARPGHTVDPQSVIAWARQRLAHFKCPKSVDLVAQMPRNATGKLLKRELRKPYWEGRARQVN